MRTLKFAAVVVVLVLLVAISSSVVSAKKPPTVVVGNNLSYPVIWAEGVTKTLRGTAGAAPVLGGAYWYWWGTAADGSPLSCQPNATDPALCLDGTAPPEGAIKAYLQKDALNVWQAGAVTATGRVVPEWLDWGDNLESVDWTIRSQVRTEVVLFDAIDPAAPMLEYDMRHLYGLGVDEVWGLGTDAAGAPVIGPGTQATVYSPCARFLIQRLLVPRDDPRLAGLIWVPMVGWTEPEGMLDDLVKPAIFNKAVWQAADGPGYYNAEINVKGRIIYGYTWNVRNLNDGAGDYRLTFSFDETCGTVSLNTFFTGADGSGVTQILLPVEEEETLAPEAEDTGGGGVAVMDYGRNLTYIDMRINARR